MSLSISDIHNIIEVVASGVQEYLKSIYHIDSTPKPITSGKAETLALRDVTAIIGLGGDISTLATISFDKPLLAQLLSLEMDGLVVPHEEHDLYMSEAAAEIANVLLGNCLAYVEDKVIATGYSSIGGRISMSPPIVIQKVSHIHQAHDAAYTSVDLVTDLGSLVMSIIWPSEFTKQVLNELNVGKKNT